MQPVDSLLLAATRLSTFYGAQLLTRATGFFFERDEVLFLVTSRHVLQDDSCGHAPDRVDIELHCDSANLAESAAFSIPLYQNDQRVWRQGLDHAGAIDVAVLKIDRAQLPTSAVYAAFTPFHLLKDEEHVEIGSSLLVVGFPLGFHDTLHHMPVVRQAVVASSFGLRFQGNGYFLTDARTHRGTSGAPVVMRMQASGSAGVDEPALPWRLLGVHSARLDVGSRDLALDEALGLNCAWYADILLTLTADLVVDQSQSESESQSQSQTEGTFAS